MLKKTIRKSCDVLVVGSGPGGAITAHALVQAGYRVLLCEEGAREGVTRSYSSGEMDRKYRRAGLTSTLGRLPLTYLEARCLGGGSEVNAGLYHRLPREILQEWAEQHGVENLEPGELEAWAGEVEKRLQIQEQAPPEPGAGQKILAGANRLGWRTLNVPRWVVCTRESGKRIEKKIGMTDSYLREAESQGLEVLTGCRILKILHPRDPMGEARGIWETNEGRKQVRIRYRQVFLCAGATQTPLLLRRSGFERGIGNSLQFQPMIRCVAEFDEPISSEETGVPPRQVTEFKPDLTLGCSACTPALLALWVDPRSPQGDLVLTRWRQHGIFYALIRSATRGKVRSWWGLGDIINYHPCETDVENLRRGAWKLGQLLWAAGARRILAPWLPESAASAQEDWGLRMQKFSPANCLPSAIHMFGSCPLGGDGRSAPLDSWGKLREADNIFVNDISMFPSPTGVNPQGSLMVMALRNINHFLAAQRGGTSSESRSA